MQKKRQRVQEEAAGALTLFHKRIGGEKQRKMSKKEEDKNERNNIFSDLH